MPYNPCTAHPADADHALETWGEAEFERGVEDAAAGRPFDPPTVDDGFDARPAPDRIADAYREGYEHVRFVREPEAAPVVAGPAPALARREAVEGDAAEVLAHMLASGVRFAARRKVEAAARYSVGRGGSTLAVPSKLSGTARFAGAVEALDSVVDRGAFVPTALYLDTHGAAPRVVVMAECGAAGLQAVGYVQAKHAPWLAPLLAPHTERGGHVSAACPVGVFVTAVTGGTPDRPTRGVNVCVTGTAAAVRASVRAAARDAAEARAYGSGSAAAVEAALA